MRLATKREVGLVLADLLAQILRSPLDFQGADDLARHCGYSRFHLTRLFQEVCGESLTSIHRRIRLERAAFRLLNGSSVLEASIYAGFDSPEAFTRAFKRSYGIAPSLFPSSGVDWKLPAPEWLHWNEHWDDPTDFGRLSRKYESRMERSPGVRLAVMRHVGNYGKLWLGWEKVPRIPDKTWVTIYYDSIWTCPHSDLMRSDLGFVLPSGDPPPGFTLMEIPAGLTVKTVRYVERNERNEAWSYMTGAWPDRTWSYDVYEDWPLPFEQVRTMVCLNVGDQSV